MKMLVEGAGKVVVYAFKLVKGWRKGGAGSKDLK